MKNKIVLLTLVSAMTLGCIVGCGSKDTDTQSSKESATSSSGVASESKEEKVESEESEEVVEIEAYLTTAWVTGQMPPEGEDLVEEGIEDLVGGEWSLTLSADGTNDLSTRFASGNVPDLIAFNNADEAKMFYDQGVLVEDWNVYADKIPNFLESMGEDAISYYTDEEGKLKAISSTPGSQACVFYIRQDWLDNLGLSMPTTPEELLNVMKAFTFDDPDGNGVDDTYGYHCAGGGSVGQIRKLLNIFGNPSFYVTDDKEVSNPVLDGSFEEYLKFAKEVIDAGVVNPDWYTIGGEELKPDLYKGKFGICYKAVNAHKPEISRSLEDKSDTYLATAWVVMDECGGKLEPMSPLGSSVLSVPAEVAKDEKKMEIICKFLNTFYDYSDGFLMLSHGYGLTEYREITRMDNGIIYSYNGCPEDYSHDPYWVMWNDTYQTTRNWQKLVANQSGRAVVGYTPEPDGWSLAQLEDTGIYNESEQYSAYYWFLQPDPVLKEDVNMLEKEFEIAYLMGETDDYDGFMKDWLKNGGQELLDDATETFGNLGLLK